jgi:hypothetical protein
MNGIVLCKNTVHDPTARRVPAKMIPSALRRGQGLESSFTLWTGRCDGLVENVTAGNGHNLATEKASRIVRVEGHIKYDPQKIGSNVHIHLGNVARVQV